MNHLQKRDLQRSIEKQLVRNLEEINQIIKDGKDKGFAEFDQLVEVDTLKGMSAPEIESQIERVVMRDRLEALQAENITLKKEMFELEKVLVGKKTEMTWEQWERKLERKLSRPEA